MATIYKQETKANYFLSPKIYTKHNLTHKLLRKKNIHAEFLGMQRKKSFDSQEL
jgi:hypothetical protein